MPFVELPVIRFMKIWDIQVQMHARDKNVANILK